MFASLNRKVVITAAVSLTAVALLLSTVPAVHADGFSFSFGSGDIAFGVMDGGLTMHARPDQPSTDKEFDRLNGEDARLHGFIDTNGYNVLLQQKHDCILVEKIKTLLRQMDHTLDGYIGNHDKAGITYQTDLIADWKARQREAEQECEKVWF